VADHDRGPDWPRRGDRRDYLTEPIVPVRGGGPPGRHRGGYNGPSAHAVMQNYDEPPGGMAPARRDPRLTYGAPVPPARPLDYPPVIYQESVSVFAPNPHYLPPARPQPAWPAVSPPGVVSGPRERVRGMNAALETGVAGVGEMAPARPPARPRQMAVAVAVAVIGLAAGALTYRSLASSPASFGGEVAPAHLYALSFGSAGAITTLKVHAGDHVTAGEVLASQDNGLAQANLQAARDAEAAAAAALYADEHPRQSNVSREQNGVTAAQSSLSGVTARVTGTVSRDNQIVSQRQQAVTAASTALADQCGTATTSAACQSLAAKLTTAKQRLTQAQTAAATARTAGQQQEQAAQGKLSERQAALKQVQAQAGGVSVTLDQAKQRLAAAKATVAQDEVTLKGKSIVAPAGGTVGAVSAVVGDSITDGNVHTPVLTVDSGPLIVSAHLPGSAIGAVRAGQPVTLGIQSLHLSLPGKVIAVNQIASQSPTGVSYTVICQIEASDSRLLAGMTVNVIP
jgi:multidrug efflux pump subunit AcrA (membrane-fusion protein)